MKPDKSTCAGRWLALPFLFLLTLLLTGEALAASGSTRVTVSIDQSVVEAIARWKGETPPAAPDTRADLAALLQPRSSQLLLQGMEHDALLVFDGGAEHAGPAGGACLTAPPVSGTITVHSI